MSLRALVLLVLAGAAGTAEAREWYEAYQEGLRALARNQAQDAVFLLEEAIGQRPAPGRNVRTYGTNVEPRYFPYLRLAEAHLALGSVEGARAALKRAEQFGVEPVEEQARLRARIDASVERHPPATVPSAAPTASTPAATPTPAAPAEASPAPSASPLPSGAPVPTVPPGTAAPVGSVRLRGREPDPTPSTSSPSSSPAPITSRLEVFSDPMGAQVYLDDRPIGVTDPASGRLLLADLAPGRHRLRLSSPDHADLVHELDLGPGLTTFRGPLAPRTQRVPLAVVVGAGAALLILAALLVRRTRRRGVVDNIKHPQSGPQALRPMSPRGEAQTPTPELPLPASFGDWMLVERLGRGGMATVYRAERGTEVRALKRPRPVVTDDPQFLERFLRESEIGKSLNHPNIVRIHERGEVLGVPFFTMELILGETLSARLLRSGAFAPRAAVAAVLQIGEALDYAHSKGVVHRDLKPTNAMIDGAGVVKVMDFGIARAQRFEGMTITGSFLGSPDYVAPEAIEGRSVDPRSDLYSLGVMLFELLTGRRPFEADGPFAVLQKHCSEAAPPPRSINPAVPQELEDVTLRLLAKSPGARYPSAEALVVELRAWLDRSG